MRKETIITLTRSEFDAMQAQQRAWWDAAHPAKKTRAKTTRKAPAKNTPRETRQARQVTPREATTAQERIVERYGLAWDDADIAYATENLDA